MHLHRAQGWTNFFLFGRAILLACPIGHPKNECLISKCTSDQDTTRKIVFFINYIALAVFTFNVFLSKSFRNEAFVV